MTTHQGFPHRHDVPARWTTAQLVDPTTSGYVVVATSSGRWRVPVALPRRARRRLLDRLGRAADQVRRDTRVTDAVVLRGVLRPPGTSDAPTDPRPLDASYDAVLLVETESVEAAAALADDELGPLRRELDDPLVVVGRNVRRIGPVDHSRHGVFLVNYFTAGSVDATLDAWQHTAGWFQDETRLDNSTVIQPVDDGTGVTLVNHCRWEHLWDVVPDLAFKRSFRDFVLTEFSRRGVAPHPVLYVLDR